ncbi:MAG: MaoC family dehydratase, partial [Candidatus Thermoplasmatota archaeon]
DDDIRDFASATGDANPIHLYDEYAKRTMFGGRIAHGMLTGGIVSAALSRLPGVVIYLSQELRFTKPVRPGDVVTVRLRVVEKIGDKPRFRLATTCANQAGEVVLDGEAVVLLMRESKP